MSEENMELLRRAWAAYDAGDIDGFAACLTDDWREYGPTGPAGGFGTLEDERRTMDSHRIAFPDKHTEIHQIVANEQTVACHCTVMATHTGAYMGLEATGMSVVVHEMMFNRVRDGKLSETWAITSGAGFFEQLTGKPPTRATRQHGIAATARSWWLRMGVGLAEPTRWSEAKRMNNFAAGLAGSL